MRNTDESMHGLINCSGGGATVKDTKITINIIVVGTVEDAKRVADPGMLTRILNKLNFSTKKNFIIEDFNNV